ncbi:MAG TPA: thiamine phosphate synthase [Chloroflexota bacterium]|nr:thiamine phosphate synthase [Chloroflexota bacterium]
MPRLQLHLVTDSRLTLERLLAVARAAVDGGVDVVQVRAKAASPDTLVALVRQVRAVVAGRVPVIVNGTVATALAAGADGVQLPEGHSDLGRARQVLGPTAYVGASVHGAGAARLAEQAGVTSITFGHIYATRSHPDEPARGLDALKEVIAAVAIPVIAIGGIDARRVPDVIATGAAGVAVISAVVDAGDPREAVRALRAALDRREG